MLGRILAALSAYWNAALQNATAADAAGETCVNALFCGLQCANGTQLAGAVRGAKLEDDAVKANNERRTSQGVISTIVTIINIINHANRLGQSFECLPYLNPGS